MLPSPPYPQPPPHDPMYTRTHTHRLANLRNRRAEAQALAGGTRIPICASHDCACAVVARCCFRMVACSFTFNTPENIENTELHSMKQKEQVSPDICFTNPF